MIRNILPKEVSCVFIRQESQLGLGHAVLCAERIVGESPFAVLLADDFFPDTNFNIIQDLIQKFETSGKSQISVVQVRKEETSKYGIVRPGRRNQVLGLEEKPEIENAASCMASIGRYVLTSDIFNVLHTLLPGRAEEIQLADAIHIQAMSQGVFYEEARGVRFDCGSIEGYLNAVSHEAKIRGFDF